MKKTISVIIPTKNRPFLLSRLLSDLLRQTYQNLEIIVLDQSSVAFEFPENTLDFMGRVKYIHDPGISGLVEAKKIGVDKACGDYIAFLDDDSSPFDDYFEKMCKVFENEPVMGLCGNVVNYPYKRDFFKYFYRLFNVGFFRGSRIGAYGSDSSAGHLIGTHQLSGGCSIWRRDVFDAVQFDLENKFHYFEDIDFSYRVEKEFPKSLYINLESRIRDLNGEAGVRDYRGALRGKISESAKIYIKYGSGGEIFFGQYVLFVLGRCLESVFLSMREKSFMPIQGFIQGCCCAVGHIVKNREKVSFPKN